MLRNEKMAAYFQLQIVSFCDASASKKQFVKSLPGQTVGDLVQAYLNNEDANLSITSIAASRDQARTDISDTPSDTPCEVLSSFGHRHIHVTVTSKKAKVDDDLGEKEKKNAFQILMVARKQYDHLPEPSLYTLITSTDQRLEYKKAFNTQYEEYRKLHAQIESVVLKFGELRSQMKGSKEGTKDFEELKNKIYREYEAKKTDPKYVEQKKRYEYLHKKLGHIKRLLQLDVSSTSPVEYY